MRAASASILLLLLVCMLELEEVGVKVYVSRAHLDEGLCCAHLEHIVFKQFLSFGRLDAFLVNGF